MAMVTMTMEEAKKIMTPERRRLEMEEMERHPIVIDEDCPEITPDLVGTSLFRSIANRKRRLFENEFSPHCAGIFCFLSLQSLARML